MRRTFASFALAGLIGLSLGHGSAQAAGSVASAADQVRPLLIGAEVPNVTLLDAEGAQVEGLFGEKPTVVIVYRGGW